MREKCWFIWSIASRNENLPSPEETPETQEGVGAGPPPHPLGFQYSHTALWGGGGSLSPQKTSTLSPGVGGVPGRPRRWGRRPRPRGPTLSASAWQATTCASAAVTSSEISASSTVDGGTARAAAAAGTSTAGPALPNVLGVVLARGILPDRFAETAVFQGSLFHPPSLLCPPPGTFA